MALDQYFVNLNNQLAAGKRGESGGISDKEYTEKYMAYAYAQRVSRLEASGIGKESTLYNPTYLDSKTYQSIVDGSIGSQIKTPAPAQTPAQTPAPTPALKTAITTMSDTSQVIDGSGNIITDGRADTTTKSPILLLVIAFIVLLFID